MSIIQQQNSDGSLSFVDNSVTGALEVLRLNGDYGASQFTNHVQLFDDFLGDVIADQWSAAAGNDAQTVGWAISAQNGGEVRATTGDTTTVSESAVVLTHALNWKASNGGLYMKARFRGITSVADVKYFIGFTDVLATTTLEIPITLSGTTLTTNATDAVGFLFDTAATNDFWHCQGVKADTDTALAVTTVAPAADTFQTFELAVDTSGTATFWINGTQVGSIANAVTTSVALTPVVSAMANTTTSKTVSLDYLFVASKRA